MRVGSRSIVLRRGRPLQPAEVVLLGFAALIVVGTVLLLLPVSRSGPGRATLMEALFTSTSAVSVTGHIVVDTPTYWSTFGQAVILVLIQLGGLGLMSVASVIFLVAGRRIGLRGRMIAQQEAQVLNLSDVRRLLIGLVVFTFLAEAVVAALLTSRLYSTGDHTFGDALWLGVFHAVSAFNNAGFALWSDSMMGFVGDWLMILTMSAAIIVGGIGYPVWLDIRRHGRRAYRWSLHTKLTLTVTGILLAAGTAIVLAMEAGNPKTLEPLAAPTKLLAAFFHSVSSRTAGFNSVSIGDMHDESLLVTDMLMFAGGGSASTAGGIKVTTLAVLVLIVLSEARGGRQAEAFGRTIPSGVLRQSLSVAFLAINAVVLGTVALLSSSPFSLSQCLFEVVSAFATVGLSTGITAQLSDFGQVVLVVLMYLGRVGPLTLAVALAARERDRMYTYPEERPLVG